jgi:hypothetical protein
MGASYAGTLAPRLSVTKTDNRWLSADAENFFDHHRDWLSTPTQFPYYHADTRFFCQKNVCADDRVLIAGCGVTDLAEGLDCKEVTLLELANTALRPPEGSRIKAIASLSDAKKDAPFQVILLPFTLQYLEDIQSFLEALREYSDVSTRIVIVQYNFLWAPLLRLAQKMGLRAKLPDLNWLNVDDVQKLISVTGFEKISSGGRCLLPFDVPLFTSFFNKYVAPLPFFQLLCQKNFVIAHRRPDKRTEIDAPSVSVLVPVRNEAGNLQDLLTRMPQLGAATEIIFVEGHSKDESWREIQRQIAAHPRAKEFLFKAFQQTGEGKADAVRHGFSEATCDILMILDADLSVQPEDLSHFYRVLVSGAAEFLNGSRLVYRMESQAMQILNLFFNKLFAVWISWLIGQSVKDTLCGTKVMWRRDYERVRRYFATLSTMDPFGDFELLFGASRLNLKISDIPVRYKNRTYGQTNIRRFSHGWELFKLCLRCWPYLKS